MSLVPLNTAQPVNYTYKSGKLAYLFGDAAGATAFISLTNQIVQNLCQDPAIQSCDIEKFAMSFDGQWEPVDDATLVEKWDSALNVRCEINTRNGSHIPDHLEISMSKPDQSVRVSGKLRVGYDSTLSPADNREKGCETVRRVLAVQKPEV